MRGRTVARRRVRLAKRSVTGVKLRFDRQAVAALRAAAGRATIKLQLRRAGGGRKSTARRTLTLRLPSGAPQPPAPGSGPGGQPAPSSASRWVGRMGTEGPYDDLEQLTLTGGQLQITKAPVVPVSCFEMGGSYRSAIWIELFLLRVRGRSGPTG